ncbi:MAG: cyclic nucleotide-binding domain-containing protein [Chthonomonadales bacterium]|nr:cyclic nucleotide-binding domain-containing protein [Chthonomonadales bacterium]
MTKTKPSPASSLNDLLTRHPLFTDFPRPHLEAIADTASEVEVHAGQTIFREGDEADRFYLIIEGSVVLEAFSLHYGAVAVQSLAGGDVFGWSVLVPPHRWRLDARATTDSRLITLDGPSLRAKCETNPELGYELLKRFAMLLDQRLYAVRRQLLERQARTW